MNKIIIPILASILILGTLTANPLVFAVSDFDVLRDQIASLGLSAGIENSLVSKIDAAQIQSEQGNTGAASNMLSALISQVNAQSGKQIDTVDASGLVDSTSALIDVISDGFLCPPSGTPGSDFTHIDVTNYAIQAQSLAMDGSLVAFLAREDQVGDIDVNGDGDAFDPFVSILDIGTRIITTLEYAVNFRGDQVVDGNFVAFAVNEAFQGNDDLNGDGDTLDNVIHVHDTSTGVTTNLGLAIDQGQIRFPAFAMDNNILAVNVIESAQGNTDLNGDGDTNDRIVHIFDATTGITTNLGIGSQIFSLAVDENFVVFTANEIYNASDLNGDGIIFGDVFHVLDTSTEITTTIDGSVFFPVFGNNLIGFEFSNSGSFQPKAGALDLNTGIITDFGLNGGQVVAGENFVGFQASEFFGGVDLNGDGDTVDHIIHVFDSNTGILSNLGLSGGGNSAGGSLFTFGVDESAGAVGVDLNGDGDTTDFVLQVYDVSTGILTSLLAESFRAPTDGNLVAFRAVEATQGTIDLNGDGDTNDLVLHIYDHSTGVTTNVGIHSEITIQVQGNLVAFPVYNPGQGGAFLNGGTDNGFSSLHVYDHSGTIDTSGDQIVSPGETLTITDGGDVGGNITVDGGILHLANSCTINGNIRISNGGSLAIIGCTINGDIQSDGALVVLTNAVVNGNTDVLNSEFSKISTSDICGNVLSQENIISEMLNNNLGANVHSIFDTFVRIMNNVISGDLTIEQSTSCTAGDNTVGGSTQTTGCSPPIGGGGL